MSIRAWGVAIAASAFSVSLLAWQGSAPPPPPPPPVPSAGSLSAAPAPLRDRGRAGTAMLSGVVLTDDNDQRPVRRAIVTLDSAELGDGKTTATDEQGRFSFESLPAGQISLRVQKTGYVDRSYGSRRPGRGVGLPIVVTEGQHITGLVIRLPHGAAITGVVTDSNGRPVANARVSMLEYRTMGGERTLSRAAAYGPSTATTDDRGTYRLFGLPAGEYLVELAPPVDGDEVRPITTADIDWAQQQLQRTGTGINAGSVSPSPRPASRPSPAPPTGYATVFYPGTVDAGAAAPVRLATGEERAGFDFSVQSVPTARIDGVVSDVSGRPAHAMLVLTRTGQPAGLPGQDPIRTTADGRFTISGVAPGEYTITARSAIGDTSAPPAARTTTAPPSASQIQWAATTFSVDGRDLPGFSFSLQPSMTMSGHLTFDGLAPSPRDLSGLKISLTQAGSPVPGLPSSLASGAINANGTFVVTGVVPGTYRLIVTGAGATSAWFLKTIIVNERDVTDRTLTIQPNDVLNNVVVTYSDRPSELSGTLLDVSGKPASGYTVVLFTTDQTLWGLPSRRITHARPAADSGRFRFSDLPPGEYYLSALTSVEPSDLSDPTFFEELIDASIKVTLGDGEKKTQDIKIAGRQIGGYDFALRFPLLARRF